jgi:hypothetical protein
MTNSYFCKKFKNMIATIELPNNKTELAFILEVLKRFNLKVQLIDQTSDVPQDILEEHAAILRERRTAMSASDAQFFTWEEAQHILANRKV